MSEPPSGRLSTTIHNPKAVRPKLHAVANLKRPHPLLSTLGEAHSIGTELIEAGLPEDDVRMHDADPDEGMPVANGDFRPLLLTFTATHPETVQPVLFNVPVGELASEREKYPQGEWFLEHDARTVRRRPV